MRRWAWVLVPYVLIVVAFGTPGVLESARGAVEPIDVTVTLTKSVHLREGPPGRQSDTQQERWRVNDEDGVEIGALVLGCRWIAPRIRLCNGELRMPLGRLIVAGTSATRFDGELVITGGAGEYFGATGTMRFRAIGIRKAVLIVDVTT